jgi:signal transduction histidine kinase
MPQRDTPRLIFASAVILLLGSGAFSAWAIYRLYQGEEWVRHTYEVELALQAIDSDLGDAGRARTLYAATADPKYLQEFADGKNQTTTDIVEVRSLLGDNKDQLARSFRLEAAAKGRLALVEKGIELAKGHPGDKLGQADISAQLAEWAVQTNGIINEMDHAEDILLQQRNRITGRNFVVIACALAFTFLLALVLIWEHYRRLAAELRLRELAEQRAQNLSVQVLRAQDEERRRISRELHDGLGQTLVASKMIADSLAGQPASPEAVAQLNSILDGAVTSVRSLSYLLYPPMLDEIGLSSAVEWLIDGLGKRSDLAVSLEITGAKRRLPSGVEIMLFRITQESLANIQRHAHTGKADIQLNFEPRRVTLRVRDYGMGISPERLRELEERSSTAGLGLAGMRQRVQEQGGTFRLSSNGNGTAIEVEVPVSSDAPVAQPSAST